MHYKEKNPTSVLIDLFACNNPVSLLNSPEHHSEMQVIVQDKYPF